MTKHKSADERTTQILDAARICFIEKGYFATKMDEIAKTAGLSKGGVYFHFNSKQDIFHTLVESECQKTQDFLDSVVIEQASLSDKLLHIGQHFVELFASSDNPRFIAVITEMTLRDQEIADIYQRMQDSYIEKIQELLESSKELPDGVDTQKIAFLLMALMDGIQLSYIHPPTFTSVEDVLQSGLDMILHGLIKS